MEGRGMATAYDAIVIGGGFYGLRIALFLREACNFKRVLVLEKEEHVMQRASYVNQARVHNGYHYPRSILTAYRSRVNHPRFVAEFDDAIVRDFDHYYAIAATSSKLNARQFELFCDRIGAAYTPASPAVARLFNSFRIEAAYKVKEPAFNALVIREILLTRIHAIGGIDINTGDEAIRVTSAGDVIEVEASTDTYRGVRVISAVYSRINQLHAASGVGPVALQHEVTEIALVRLPPEFQRLGITVMDGPFFSVMPFPARDLHSLTHVRYTPQHRWRADSGSSRSGPHTVLSGIRKKSSYVKMAADAARYIPSLTAMEHVDSMYEIKTVLAKSDSDDSRPILFRADHGIRNYTCIMGGKLDNVYDVLQELKLIYAH